MDMVCAWLVYLSTTGEQVMIYMLKEIWNYVLETWKLRNKHLRNNASQLNLPNYRQAAISLYEQ